MLENCRKLAGEEGPAGEISRDLTRGVFAAAARNTMRSAALCSAPAGGTAETGLFPLPNTPTLDMFNSGPVWPRSITRVQQLGYFRAGPRLRGWKCTFPTPRGRPYSPFLFRCKDTAFPPGVVSASCDCVLLCPFLVFGQDAPESQRKD